MEENVQRSFLEEVQVSCRKFPSRGEREKPGTLALLGLGLRIPTPGMVSQASHMSAVRECLSIKLFFRAGY